MRAIRDFFSIQYTIHRDDLVPDILKWMYASGESPFHGNSIDLFLASRRERYRLDRGIVPTLFLNLTEVERRKIAAIKFLLSENLMFLAEETGTAAGIFREAKNETGIDTRNSDKKLVRLSYAENRGFRAPAVLLFQVMEIAGFKYESETYARSDPATDPEWRAYYRD
jgi:hypothetical protein